MLPALSPLPAPDAAGVHLPPTGFRPVAGLVTARRMGAGGGFSKDESGLSDAQRSGLRYERKVKDQLTIHFPKLELGPWYSLTDNFGTRPCQLDALLLDPLCVIEVKAHHDVRAWWQTRKLYSPVIEKLMGKAPAVAEITSSYDPAVPWPEEPTVLFDFDSFFGWLQAPKGFAIFQWKL